MSSDAQIAANRANSQRSTGPRTSTGIANSRHNATKHGLSGAQIVIKGEDPAAYDALRQSLYSQHAPATEQEAIFVEEIAQNFWRLQRARRCEQQLLQKMDLATALTDKTYRNFERHANRIERNLARASRELKLLQAARAKSEREQAQAESLRERKQILQQLMNRRDERNGSVLPDGNSRRESLLPQPADGRPSAAER